MTFLEIVIETRAVE